MRSAVEMMIGIPVVMTGEIESWPREELMYCSRANVWQEWGFSQRCAQAWHTAPLIPCNNWLKKTKYCGKGRLGGACKSKVCLHHPWPWFLYKLALSLSMRERERRRKRHKRKEKKKTVLLWLMYGSPPATQAMFMPGDVGSNLGWSWVFLSFLILLSPHNLFSISLFFLVFHSWLTQVLNTGWKQKLVGGI